MSARFFYGQIVRVRVARHGKEKLRPVVVVTPNEAMAEGALLVGVAIIGTPEPPTGFDVPLPRQAQGRARTGLDKPNAVAFRWFVLCKSPTMLDRFHSRRRSTGDPHIWQRLLEILHARVGDPRAGEVEILQSGHSLQVRDYSVIDTTAGKPKGVKVRQIVEMADLLFVNLRPGEFDRDDTLEVGLAEETNQPGRPDQFPFDVGVEPLETRQTTLLGRIGLVDSDLPITQNHGEHCNKENQPGEPESQVTAGKHLDRGPEHCGRRPQDDQEETQRERCR
jgi:hypothetical protein